MIHYLKNDLDRFMYKNRSLHALYDIIVKYLYDYNII